MQMLLASFLALSGIHLVNATPGSARVTQAPVPIPNLFRRQNDICPPGDYTVCPDGFGCCENGAPCTTIRGEPACDTDTCNGTPCGDSGLCCDAVCSSSLGTGICVHTGLATDDSDFDFTVPTLTTTDDYFTTSTFNFDGETTGAATATDTDDDDDDFGPTSAPDETTEDLPTIATPTATGGLSGDGEEDDDNTASAEPTQTFRSGGGDDSSSDDDQLQSGGGDGTDGAGMVSAKGAFGVLAAALIGGALLLR
ncbi:uncharacterized protein BDV17DRAFT_272802 [Aspergillus undulatus]|uniref:uncharacterized protein n=1 Tax=Aspergillus undulatus TaxID=1810928 RepID=UPI003CCE1DCF